MFGDVALWRGEAALFRERGGLGRPLNDGEFARPRVGILPAQPNRFSCGAQHSTTQHSTAQYNDFVEIPIFLKSKI